MSDRLGAVRLAFVDVDLADPVALFAFGVEYGRALERERQDELDDQVHRAGVRHAIAAIEQADQRSYADRPGPRPGDYPGRCP